MGETHDRPTALRFRHVWREGLVSVVVPVGRDPEGLAVTLGSLVASIEAAGAAGRTETVVANDGADPAVDAVCRRFGVRRCALDPGRGSYAARNAALERSRGARVLFLDAGQTVTPPWFGAMTRALDEADYVVGATRLDVAAASSFGERLDCVTDFLVEDWFAAEGWGPTCNLGVARRIFEIYGGFDRRLRSGGDREFGTRLPADHVVKRFAPDALILHPPRDLRRRAAKARRVRAGDRALARHYPDRFAGLAGGVGRLRRLLPLNPWKTDWRRLSAFGPLDAAAFYAVLHAERWSLALSPGDPDAGAEPPAPAAPPARDGR